MDLLRKKQLPVADQLQQYESVVHSLRTVVERIKEGDPLNQSTLSQSYTKAMVVELSLKTLLDEYPTDEKIKKIHDEADAIEKELKKTQRQNENP